MTDRCQGNPSSEVDKIIEYIADVADLPDDMEFNADTSLFNNHLLDSMNLVALIAFLEEDFGIKVKPMDITIRNFDTVNLIFAYIKRQQMNKT